VTTTTATAVGIDDALGVVVGLLAPGEPLPTVDDLAHRLGARRVEVLEGLDRLAARRAVEWVPGEDRLVAGRVVHRVDPGQPASLTGSLLASCRVGRRRTVHHELLDAAVVPAGPDVGARLDTDRVVTLARRTWLDDRPVAWGRVWLPADDVPGLVDAAGTGSLHRALRDRYGITTVRASTQVEVEVPPIEVCRALALEGRPPAWWLRSTGVRHDDGRPMEIAEGWLRFDTFRVPLPR
jgi:DNA-binding GntR family transcriptional regulator